MREITLLRLVTCKCFPNCIYMVIYNCVKVELWKKIVVWLFPCTSLNEAVALARALYYTSTYIVEHGVYWVGVVFHIHIFVHLLGPVRLKS